MKLIPHFHPLDDLNWLVSFSDERGNYVRVAGEGPTYFIDEDPPPSELPDPAWGEE